MKKMSAERSKISSKLILLQAAWDTSIARTYGFYVTSSRMLPVVLIEGNKNLTAVKLSECILRTL